VVVTKRLATYERKKSNGYDLLLLLELQGWAVRRQGGKTVNGGKNLRAVNHLLQGRGAERQAGRAVPPRARSFHCVVRFVLRILRFFLLQLVCFCWLLCVFFFCTLVSDVCLMRSCFKRFFWQCIFECALCLFSGVLQWF
jgi:hypothetical protein